MLKGLYAALITPIKDDESIDFEAYRKLIRMVKDGGLDGIFLTGSTSEFVLYTKEERKELIRVAVEEANGELSVIAHCAAASLKESCEIAKYAESIGVDAITAVPPRYYKFTTEEILRFYTRFCESVSCDVIAYNIPALTGIELFEERFDWTKMPSNFKGMKASAPNLYLQERFLRLNPDKIVLHGFDESLLPAVIMGATGGIGGTYALLPKLFAKLYKASIEGDIELAKELQHKVNPVLDGMIPHHHTKAAKYLLSKMGIGNGKAREPFSNYTPEAKAQLDEVYELIKKLNEEYK